MAVYKKPIINLPLSLLVACIVTSLLFIAIPLLTKFSRSNKKREKVHHVLISQRKPPPPPELEQEERIEEKKKTEKIKKTPKQQRMARPKLNVQMAGLSGSLGGTIEIGGLLKNEFEVSDSLFVSAFKLNEVDQPPSTLRSFPPRYPFEAKQKGISGKVKLKFVVDSNGRAQEPQVVKSEPEGVFDEAALEAVVKYKYKPAMKGGKPVDCIATQVISFDLND